MDKGRYGRRDRLLQEKRHDTYKEYGKWPEPTVCNHCGAVFSGGRWAWTERPEGAHEATCAACQRIADDYPAGLVEIAGGFFPEHQDEMMNLVHNEEKNEKTEHPMERIMGVASEREKTIVKTTGVHLARRLGEALVRAYQGDLDFAYGDGEKSIRVVWSR